MKLWALRIPYITAEDIRMVLHHAGYIHPDAQIRRDDTHILIPVIKKPEPDELGALPGAGENIVVIEAEFEPKRKKPSLAEILGFKPNFDVIGDIAIIDADDPDATRIAKALMNRKSINVVLGAVSPVEGAFRTRQWVVLAGEHRTRTIHKEHGCRYNVDLAGAYFSARLGTERKRVADMVKPGQYVADLFAGVGPFCVLIGKSVPGARVVAVDKNPRAVELLRENIRLNRLANVKAVEDDARHAAVNMKHSTDHVIMNLPHSAREFLNCGILAAKSGGVVHFYDITHENDLYGTSWKLIQEAAACVGKKVECVEKRIVRSYAPHQYNVCIEFRVINNDAIDSS
jgi:tRNA (guanine37-N1)-methyltransferase